jgi:hypothetical protein
MAAKRKTGRDYDTIKKKISKKTGAKKAAVKKASAPKQQPEASTEVDTVKPTAAASAAAQPKSEEEMKAFLERIDAPSLHDDDIAATLDHLNTVVAFRRAVGQPGAAAKRGLSGKCYEKAFGDPVVSIYDGTIKVGEMTEESALAAGIPRCGA